MGSDVIESGRANSGFPQTLLGYLTLKRTLSPYLLPVLCAVLIVLGLLSGLQLYSSGGPISGVIVMIAAPCFARIFCEAVSQLFVIARALEEMRLKQR